MFIHGPSGGEEKFKKAVVVHEDGKWPSSFLWVACLCKSTGHPYSKSFQGPQGPSYHLVFQKPLRVQGRFNAEGPLPLEQHKTHKGPQGRFSPPASLQPSSSLQVLQVLQVLQGLSKRPYSSPPSSSRSTRTVNLQAQQGRTPRVLFPSCTTSFCPLGLLFHLLSQKPSKA